MRVCAYCTVYAPRSPTPNSRALEMAPGAPAFARPHERGCTNPLSPPARTPTCHASAHRALYEEASTGGRWVPPSSSHALPTPRGGDARPTHRNAFSTRPLPRRPTVFATASPLAQGAARLPTTSSLTCALASSPRMDGAGTPHRSRTQESLSRDSDRLQIGLLRDGRDSSGAVHAGVLVALQVGDGGLHCLHPLRQLR